MIDQNTLFRLMLGLIVVVYVFLTYLFIRQERAALAGMVATAAAVIVIGLWVFVPLFVLAADFTLPSVARRIGLVAGGFSVLARYLSARRAARGAATQTLDLSAPPLLALCLVLGSANWIVGVAGFVLVGSDLVRRVAASVRGSSRQSPHPPDTQ